MKREDGYGMPMVAVTRSSLLAKKERNERSRRATRLERTLASSAKS